MILAGEDRSTRSKISLSATSSTISPTWLSLSQNLALRGDRLATEGLSHGTALKCGIGTFLLRVISLLLV